MSKKIRNVAPVLLLLVIIAITFGCWGSPTFKLIIENQSEQNLTIFVNDYEIGNVSPGQQITDEDFLIDTGKFKIIAKNAQGEIALAKTYRFEQMQKIDSRVYKVVIPPDS